MSKFLKLLIVVVLFGLGSQLLAQDVYDTPEEVDREISKQEQREMRQNLAQEKMNKLSWGQRMWMGAQDAKWREFEAAHKRAHQKFDEHPGKKVKKSRGHKILSYVIVGGVSFWIGHETAKSHRKKDKFDKRWDYKGDKK